MVAKRKTGQREAAPKKIANKATAKRRATEPQQPQEIVREARQPAATITIQSWAWPMLGLLMLILGLLAGYYIIRLTRAQASGAKTSSGIVTAPIAVPSIDISVVQQSQMELLLPNVRHFKGDPKARVTMIEFSDFQCPYCGRFFVSTEPQINEQYIQTGKVRFGYFNYALLGPASVLAAEAAECASDQGKFWEYHDALFKSQTSEKWGGFGKDNLKKFAEELGLNTATFNDCLDSGKYTALIKSDSNYASSLRVLSTPTFFINGRALVGAQPFEVFQQTFEAFLKQQ